MPAFAEESPIEFPSTLARIPSGSAAAAVATRLLEQFTSGALAAGTRLPPERQLAASLDVGRSAVREALAALEILGIVDVRPGSGTYLRGTASELLPKTLSWGIMIGDKETAHLVDVRGALEIYAARLAVDRMSDAAVERLSEHLDHMRAALPDLGAFVEADLQFHLELAAATDNTVLLDLLQSIRSLLRVWVERAVATEQQATDAIAEHTAVYLAIKARDADAAASAMATHMHTAADRLLGEAPITTA